MSKSVRDLIAEGYRVEDVDGNMWIVILEPDFTEADTLLESGKEATQRENALALVEMRLKNDTSFQMIRKGNSHKVVDLILNGLAQTLNEIRVPGATDRQLADEVYNILIELLAKERSDVLR